MKPNILTKKKSFNPINEVIRQARLQPRNLNAILNAIIYSELVIDNFGVISSPGVNPYYRMNLKKAMLNLNAYIKESTAEDKKTMDKPLENMEDLSLETERIINEESILTTNIALLKVPTKNMLNDLAESFNKKPKLLGSITEKIIKNNKETKATTKEERIILRLMEYSVNLIFLKDAISQIKHHRYDIPRFTNLINATLQELEKVLKIKAKMFFKEDTEYENLFKKYESISDFFKETNVQQRNVLSQIIDAWNMDQKSIEGTIK